MSLAVVQCWNRVTGGEGCVPCRSAQHSGSQNWKLSSTMQICVHGGRRVMATSSLHCFHRCCSLRWQPTPASCAVSGPSICLMHSNSHRASCCISCANNFHAHYLVRALYHVSKLMALIVRLSPYCLTVLCRCVSCCVSLCLSRSGMSGIIL